MATPERHLTPSPKRLKLLSLDGGGVKGISSLVILHAIMNEVRDLTGQNDLPLPVGYFDLAGGTSTGGLIALMLFRLRMSTMYAIRKFKEIAQELFSPRIGPINLHDFGVIGYYLGNPILKLQAVASPSRFPSEPLKEAIDKVMGESSYLEDTERKGKSKLLNEESGRMFMCATRVDKGEAVLFRSYTPPSDAGSSDFRDVDVVSAACATSAAPTFFPSVKINGVDFWDGGLLNNNPINQVWNARYDLAPPLPPVNEVAEEPIISCVVSVGTGYHRQSGGIPEGFLDKLSTTISYTMNTKAKDEDFRGSLERLNLRKSEDQKTMYFRFDAPIRELINIDDWQKMPILEEDTNTWLRTGEGQELIKECARLLSHVNYTKPH